MTDSAPKGPFIERVPDQDDRPRMVCGDCGYIHYVNPKVVVGVVSVWDGKILMARRAINPRKGFWTVPAGFLEVGESTAEGAARETREEANATVTVGALLGLYDIPHIGQIHMMFRGDLVSGAHTPGPESLETELMDWADIPWDDLAFPSVRQALHDFEAAQHLDVPVPTRMILEPMT